MTKNPKPVYGWAPVQNGSIWAESIRFRKSQVDEDLMIHEDNQKIVGLVIRKVRVSVVKVKKR